MVELAMAPPVSSIETEVVRIRGLMQANQFAAALSAGNQLLTQVPENRDVLYVVAVSQRYLGRITDALDTLMRFEKIHPRYSRLFQERGHCYVAARNPGAAIEAYLAAVNINVALPASWQALQVLFRSAGRTADADTAAAHVATLAKLPVEVVTATSMFADGEIHEAERIVRQYLLTHGNHVEAMRLLAKIGMKLDVLDDAEFLLESVLILAPDYHAARYDYALALLARHKHVRALEELEKLLEVDPDNRTYRPRTRPRASGLGDHARALQLYRELLEGAPQRGRFAPVDRARAQDARAAAGGDRFVSRPPPLPAQFRRRVLEPRQSQDLSFPDDEIAQMRAQEAAAATPLVDRYHLCFALGKALEDRGEYAESFGYYERGNALKKARDPLQNRTDRAQRAAADERLHARILCVAARVGLAGSGDPIFIVGLPRAGSTLLEQILASHSQSRRHDGAGRYSAARAGAAGPRDQRIATRATRRCWRSSRADQLKQLGEKYLADTRGLSLAASRSSSTRCRIISATSASFT